MQLGSKVRWWSGGRGKTQKVGTIVAVVPPSCRPSMTLCNRFTEHERMFTDTLRYTTTYLVEVPPKTAGGRAKLYWPFLRNLREVKDEGDNG